MKAIETRYLGATATKPARISATDHDGHRSIYSTSSLGDTLGLGHLDNGISALFHKLAARKFAHEMGWTGKLVGGWLKRSMVWVFTS
jgi:hypothetical protein